MPNRHCNFCGCHEDAAMCLVAQVTISGIYSYICDHCVVQCVDVIMTQNAHPLQLEKMINGLRAAVIQGQQRIKLTQATEDEYARQTPPPPETAAPSDRG